VIAFLCLGLVISIAVAVPPPSQQQDVAETDHPADSVAVQNNPVEPTWRHLWRRTFEDPVAFYTFVLAVFTAVLAIVSGTQIAFLIKADKTARISSHAAKTAADAAVTSVNEFREKERARLVITNAKCQFGPKEDPGDTPKTYTITVAHQFLNYGATPAVLGDYKGKIFFGTNLPENPASNGGTIKTGPFQTPLLSTQLGDVQEINGEVTLIQDEWEQVQADTPDGFKMFVVISVVFKDTFGTIRTAFFALKFKGSYFVQSGDEAYNYERVGEIEW
jgi:hypothetical protein